MWAGNSGTQPGAGNGTCGSATLSNTLSGASYANAFVYTNLGNCGRDHSTALATSSSISTVIPSRTYSSTTAALTYDLLDHFVSWNAGSNNKDLYVYDASGTRVLRRTTSSSGTTMTVYAFGLEEHNYWNIGTQMGK